ncbi:hypothetical protein llap_4769 [Limosa lapponica baueri]|uniref:BEN domain-containing protein n=1 Tax=Limosa lapponica baueri TaxID=1758121 RepID=A0A2I0UFU8_LIMLA|nr:hypothetical protein llap_4769 [Limosa lapponica baueri]
MIAGQQRPSYYVSVNVEDDDEAVMIDHGENGLSTQSCVSMGQNSEVNSVHHVAQLAYGLGILMCNDNQSLSEILPNSPVAQTKINRSCYEHLMRIREGEYEDSDSVIYEYEPDYECAMYDAIQKLDKKFDLLHRKVSEMQHTRLKPLFLKPLATDVVESTCNIASSPVASSSMPAPSETSLGNNAVAMNYRNTSGSVNISKELPSSSVSINPSFEFLATNFPNCDLSEHGKDWKTCITNVNAMIRCLRSETKIKPETAEGKEIAAVAPDTSHCVDLNYNEDSEGNSQNSQKMTSSITDTLQNSGLDKFPEAFHTSSVKKLQSLEPMELLGSPWRNVQLPFSVIYVAKGKSRPELSARYLIRHMFTEDVLVKSNVYGNLERGMSPLDCNRINALRGFVLLITTLWAWAFIQFPVHLTVCSSNLYISSFSVRILQETVSKAFLKSSPEHQSSLKIGSKYAEADWLSFLIHKTPHQLHCPSPDLLQHLNVFPGVRGPKLDIVFEVGPHQCRVQGDNHFPSPAGHSIPDTGQDAVGLLGHLGKK